MKKNDEPVIVEQIFDDSICNVWHAITDIKQMKQWFFDNIEAFKPEVGFETRFVVETENRVFPHLWKLTKVEPMKRIIYNWKYEGYPGDSFVTFELTKQDYQTKLTVHHKAVESFPQDIPEFSRESCIGGWNYFIKQNLKEYLENRMKGKKAHGKK